MGRSLGGLVKSSVFTESVGEVVSTFLVEKAINCSGVETTLGVSADGSGNICFLGKRPSLRPTAGLRTVRGLDDGGDSLGEEPLGEEPLEVALGDDERCEILKDEVE
jgi:hypothetical protein